MDRINTINGRLETSSLMVTSIYYQYIVYFFIAFTTLMLTLNALLNPDMDIGSSLVVIVPLMIIFLVVKYI